MTKTLALLLPLLACAACAGPRSIAWDGPDGETAAAELMAADRAFAADAAADGLDGWMRWFAEDAARLDLPVTLVAGEVSPVGVVRQLAAIRAHDAPVFASPELRLDWEPSDAGVFADGRYGFTVGRWRIQQLVGDQGPTLPGGWYLTWWRWEDGGWRVVLDTGGPDPAAPVSGS
ncbi:MAG: hypothetical protein ISR76_03620 [Planctomycetes bacterium]|nr:hypothetical protein [Planctomycetota bacterium]